MRIFVQILSFFIILILFCTNSLASGFDYGKEDVTGNNLGIYYERANSDRPDYGRTGHGAYFFAGGAYTYRLLTDTTQTVTNPTQSINYTAKGNVPRGFYGFHAGVGAQLSRHVDLQLSYLQNFSHTTKPTLGGLPSTVKTSMNALEANFGYVFNPEDQIQMMATLGVMASEMHQTFTIGGAAYYPTTDQTKIDPTIGGELAYYFTKTVAVRAAGEYVASTSRTASNCELNGFIGLSVAI